MATSFSSDQTTLLMDTIAADTLSRAGRARITSIQGKGIASSVLKLHDCATAGGTDDRHQFSYVNFNNTEDAVFRSGSRHDGSGPSCGSSTADCNTGNYTMSEVTFTDVGAVFTHGSGQGTVLTMSDFTIDGVDESCFYFAENTMAPLLEGTMKNCNTDGNVGDGAIMSVAGSSSGMLVAENLTVEGGISGEGEIHIDGIVRGDVRIGKLTIGDTGHVEGSIFAEVVEARGRVIGAITAKQVRLYGTCYVDGDITHEQLAMETGAFFQGRSLKFQRPPAEPPAKSAPPALEAPTPSPTAAAASNAPQPKPVF